MSNWKVGPGGRLYHPTTGAYVGQLDDNGNEQMVVSAFPSGEGRTYEVAGIDVTDELTGGVGGGTLSSGTYNCDVGTRTWSGTIRPSLLTLTPGAGGTAYIEMTQDGTTWVPWSEGVVSAATVASLVSPAVGLRVISTVSASTLGVVA